MKRKDTRSQWCPICRRRAVRVFDRDGARAAFCRSCRGATPGYLAKLNYRGDIKQWMRSETDLRSEAVAARFLNEAVHRIDHKGARKP